MRVPASVKVLSIYIATTTPFVIINQVFAASPAGASQVQNFLTNIINIVAGLASTLAAGGLVWSGIVYMTATKDGKRIHIPDPETRGIMPQIFKKYLEPGESILTITAEMKRLGIRTRGGRC